MNDAFNIYSEHLKDGQTEKIREDLLPDFLEIDEEDLKFNRPIHIEGDAYLADTNLILHLDILAYGMIPCSICNKPVEVEIAIKNFYHVEPVEGLTNGLFCFQELLRETILLEVPQFAECNQGQCPERAKIAKYLKKTDPKKTADEDEGHYPFADIKL